MRHLLPGGLALALLAPACGPTEPAPTPSPSTSPTPTACGSASPSPYATAVTEWWVPACSLAQNVLNDPRAALGPPDAASVPGGYTGFVSLGFGGRVTVDLGGCISDRAGPDLRVFQAVSSEPVTVYVSVSPEGPYTLVEAFKPCGERVNPVIGYCDFDIASGGASQARYVRVEDGELYPCPGGTTTEGADLDAVQALGVPTSGSPPDGPR